MINKDICIANVVFSSIGILLLLGAAFDILPIADNQAIFFAIACFIVGRAIEKIVKGGGSCCK
ncbi:MAG: hypothetical protein ABH806_03740 [Candidatus Omnitrophota bacterium]